MSIFCKIFSIFNMNDGILHIILWVPQNIVMNMNNVMHVVWNSIRNSCVLGLLILDSIIVYSIVSSMRSRHIVLCNVMLSMLVMESFAPLWKLHVNLYRYVDSCQHRDRENGKFNSVNYHNTKMLENFKEVTLLSIDHIHVKGATSFNRTLSLN